MSESVGLTHPSVTMNPITCIINGVGYKQETDTTNIEFLFVTSNHLKNISLTILDIYHKNVYLTLYSHVTIGEIYSKNVSVHMHRI